MPFAPGYITPTLALSLYHITVSPYEQYATKTDRLSNLQVLRASQIALLLPSNALMYNHVPTASALEPAEPPHLAPP